MGAETTRSDDSSSRGARNGAVDRTETAPGPPALGDLIRRHLPHLRAYVRRRAGRLIRAHESCSDITQSVCRELLQDVDDLHFEGDAGFRAWLRIAADRKIVERHRYHTRTKRDAARTIQSDGIDEMSRDATPSVPTSRSPSLDADLNEQIELLDGAFDALPEDYRRVITLFFVAGLPHREIAVHMNRNEAASRKLLSRAVARLGLIMRARDLRRGD